MAVKRRPDRDSRPPFDGEYLEQLALRYVGRYATTGAKLSAYLRRKVRERGWEEFGDPVINRIVDRVTALGYVDDRAYASARAASLGRRGFGERRIRDSLRAAGVDEEDSAEAREGARRGAWAAALTLAKRRGIGPFADVEPDRRGRERAYGILLRAGHPPEIARRLAFAPPGEVPDADTC